MLSLVWEVLSTQDIGKFTLSTCLEKILCECEEVLGPHSIGSWDLQGIPIKCLLNFGSATGLF